MKQEITRGLDQICANCGHRLGLHSHEGNNCPNPPDHKPMYLQTRFKPIPKEVTMQMASEIIDSLIEDAKETLSKNGYMEEPFRSNYINGLLRLTLANAIVKGQLSKEDLGIK